MKGSTGGMLLGVVLAFVLAGGAFWVWSRTQAPAPQEPPQPAAFDGQRAYQDVQYQVSLGPRLVGSPAHNQTVDYIRRELEAAGWEAGLQESV
mgnify:CR=1 FL=1